ncbi:hypothetical protein OG592_41780 (plasmid) [Streptomyces avidinii]|uniref:hypothetical protein n=1 Tax=Streptomyces avidinii TaxID=1895 RepID=UPI002F90C6A8|nr:hypothetical protein OG592_41780 [Streptomyces avidinii]
MLFDDLVRRTAAGTIVPVEYLRGTKVDRFWVTDADRDRLADLQSGVIVLPPTQPDDSSSKSSPNLPTCRPTAILDGSVPAAVVGPDATVLIPEQRAFASAPPRVEAFDPGPQPPSLSALSSPSAPGETGRGESEPEQVTPPSADFPTEIEQVYDSGVTTTAPTFPDELLRLQ